MTAAAAPAQPSGTVTSNFKADREKQVTQTVGVNPAPPATRSQSVPADAPPIPDCIIGPYSGLY
jgi:hypothetical protein